jgi:hypothetical protein
VNGTPFAARVLGRIDNGKGYWESVRVGVFEGDAPYGAYVRNYGSYGAETFSPFRQDGVWYALYAPDYTGTRALKLTGGMTDWAGESRDEFGFCPVQLWVPWEQNDGRWGFIVGCVWGDDCSWKVQVADLRRLADRELVRIAPFGYAPLVAGADTDDPQELALEDVVEDVAPSSVRFMGTAYHLW